jgi:hypothetical protein
LKELCKKQSEIIEYGRKLPEGRIEKKKISYTEVTDDIWNMLMEDEFFKRSAEGFFPDVPYANTGGFEVRRGSDFVVHSETYIKEKLELSPRIYKKAGRRGRPPEIIPQRKSSLSHSFGTVLS